MKTENISTIIIILIILLIISGMIAPRFFEDVKPPSSRPILYRTNIVNAAIDTYKLHTGVIPKTLEDLITCPIGLGNLWKGPYLKPKLIVDPWGNPYVYEPNTAALHGYNLISYGADGKPGGEGYDADIYND